MSAAHGAFSGRCSVAALLAILIGAGAACTAAAEAEAPERPAKDARRADESADDDEDGASGGVDPDASDDDTSGDPAEAMRGDAGTAAAPDGGADGAPGRLIEHVVAPKTADPTVTTLLEDEYAYRDPRVAAKNVLVFYLAGQNAAPKVSVGMLKEIASYGYHVVGVRYDNTYRANDICAADADADCHGKLRLEALEGRNHSRHIAVPRPNAIEVRITKLLEHLAKNFGSEGWGQFLDGAAPKWSAMVASGHSHGATEAGRIGMVRPLAGVAMFAGPYDHRGTGPATWMKQTPQTPVSRMFAFAHSADAQYKQDVVNWQGLGLPGRATSVDSATPPFGGSHRLTTSRAGGGHGSIVVSGSTPMVDGTYAYRPVWRTMFP